jgi:hypothetical protein
MPRPADFTRRDYIRRRRLELEAENPLMSLSKVNLLLAEEMEVTEHTIRYYLRTASYSDSRLRYTADERTKLCQMSRQELLAYAAKHNRNPDTLYAMVWRHKNKSTDNAARIRDYQMRSQARGFFDFSRRFDLQAYSFPADAFKEARKAVSAVPGLDLLPPNYLISRTAHKFYPLNLQEQHFLLSNPRRFLKENGARIAQNWKSSNPNGHYFVLLAGEETDHYHGQVVSTHETVEAAAEAASRLLHADPPVSTRVIRKYGDSRAPQFRYQPGEMVHKNAPDDVQEPHHEP